MSNETFFLPCRNSPRGPRPPHYRGFMITLRHTTLGKTPLDERSARRTDLTTHNTHKRQTSMPPPGFEPTTPASERPKTHALDSAGTGIGQTRHCDRTALLHTRPCSTDASFFPYKARPITCFLQPSSV